MRLVSLLFASAFLIGGRLEAQATATAAEGEVFLAAEVDASPRLKVEHIHYHPKDRLDRSAKVVVQFVVDTAGHPVPGSTRVASATDTTFVPAAIMTLLAREYSPGTSRGQKVRVLMQEGISFRGKDVRCDTLVDAQGVVLCADSLRAGH